MAPRPDLQILLEEISDHVYFQPPPTFRMEFPCIVYQRDGSKAERAGNKLYRHTKRYQVTVIDRDPDSELPDMVLELPMCEFNRYFPADNLNHHVFTLFF